MCPVCAPAELQFLFISKETPSHLEVGAPPTSTSDLLLQAEDDGHGLVQHQQLGLGLLTLQVQLTHVAQLLERLVDVPHAQALASVVGHPPLALALGLLLRAQVLVLMDAAKTF